MFDTNTRFDLPFSIHKYIKEMDILKLTQWIYNPVANVVAVGKKNQQ